MYSIAQRERVRDRVLELAASDRRVVAGAVVGSLALADGDHWSDLDLTFALADGCPVRVVLDDWSAIISAEFDAVQLFDLASGASLYRVFLLPGCLQFDLSFTPAAAFTARGPKFRQLFGPAAQQAYAQPPAAQELFGYAVHHALRARFCIARGRVWQAEYWISGVRDYGLNLACLRRGLPARDGRGFDDLPDSVREPFRGALVTSFEKDELLRALGRAIDALLGESVDVQALAARVEPQLRELMRTWDA